MQNTQIIPQLHAQPLTSAACPWLLFPAEVPAQQPEHTSPIAPAAFPHTSYSQSHPLSFPTQWGTPPPTYCAHNIIKQQSPVLSKAFMCSQHFKRHSTCCMLDAVRLQDWILQCFRKKVRQEESVRGGNRPSFVEFFLRVYAWLYKRAFFFSWPQRDNIISHRPVSKSCQTISTQTSAWLRQWLWRGNPLSKYDMEIPWPQLQSQSTRVQWANEKEIKIPEWPTQMRAGV